MNISAHRAAKRRAKWRTKHSRTIGSESGSYRGQQRDSWRQLQETLRLTGPGSARNWITLCRSHARLVLWSWLFLTLSDPAEGKTEHLCTWLIRRWEGWDHTAWRSVASFECVVETVDPKLRAGSAGYRSLKCTGMRVLCGNGFKEATGQNFNETHPQSYKLRSAALQAIDLQLNT